MKEKIKNKLFNKTWKKLIFIFLIVFLCVFIGGLTSVNYLNDVVTNNHVHTQTIYVKDKLYGDNPFSDYFIVVDGNNHTYSIVNHDDGYGKKMFDSLEIGKTYRATVKEPELTDVNQFTHILQVYNGGN